MTTTMVNSPAQGCLTGDVAVRGEEGERNSSSLPRHRAHDAATLNSTLIRPDTPRLHVVSEPLAARRPGETP